MKKILNIEWPKSVPIRLNKIDLHDLIASVFIGTWWWYSPWNDALAAIVHSRKCPMGDTSDYWGANENAENQIKLHEMKLPTVWRAHHHAPTVSWYRRWIFAGAAQMWSNVEVWRWDQYLKPVHFRGAYVCTQHCYLQAYTMVIITTGWGSCEVIFSSRGSVRLTAR